ncbi:beta strand repeat-containing protein [Flavitalea flava]
MKALYYALIIFSFTGSSLSLSAANRYWIASGSSSWNTSANWSATSGGAGGAGVPAIGDNVYFDNLGPGNCSIPVTITISSLTLNSSYTGTITQSSNPVTISGAVILAGGTLVGSSGTITVNGSLTFSGTTFTFPATLNMAGSSWTYTTGSLDLTTNNTTVVFNGNTTINGSHSLNNISFSNTSPWPLTYTLAAGTTLTATGNMNMTGTAALNFSGGTINLLGNLSLTNTASGGGSTILNFGGSTNQQITSSLPTGQSSLPSVTINKTTGSLILPALLTMGGNNWTYTTGTIDATTNNSTVVFTTNTTITGSHTLNHIFFSNTTPWPVTYTLASGTTLTAFGNMTMSGSAALNLSGGTINLLGNLNLTNTATGSGGSTIIAFTGSTNQSITSSLAINQSALPSITISKPSGTLIFPSLLTMGGTNWIYTTGALDVITNNSNVVFGANTTITGSHSLNTVTFSNTTPWGMTYTLATGTVLTASGNMNISGGSSQTFSGGTINLLGNLNLTNTATGSGGSSVIAFTGTTNQSITSSLAINQSALPSININKASGTLTFPPLLTMAGTNWTYTTGALDITTNNSNVVFGGNTTITGSHTLNTVTFSNTTPWGMTYTLATGTILTASGDMNISGGATQTFSGGTINLLGNLNLTNTATGSGGSSVIAFTGTTNQSITSSLAINQSALPSININKASGTLTFPPLLTMAGTNWTYTTGALDVTTNNSNVVFGGNTTITGSHTLNTVTFSNTTPWGMTYTVAAGTTLTAGGDMNISGGANQTFSGGNINLLKNLNLTNTATGSGGTTVIGFTGTTNQNINSSLAVNQSTLPSVAINKTSGTLSFPALLTIGGNSWTYTAGTVDAASAASNITFVNNNTIKSAGMAFYNFTVANGTSTLGNDLTVNNNLTISSPGVLSGGANTINLSGNWNNWGSNGFTEATSTLNLIGSTVQTISSPGGENFSGLTINNNGFSMRLGNNVTVAKTLTMTQGNIDLNSNTLTLGINTANPGTLSRTTGTIVGSGSFTRWFKTGTIATGSTAGLFPVGTTTDYRPFTVTAPTTGPTTGGTITLSYTDGVTNTNVSFPDGGSTVAVRKNLNWALSTGNGLAGGSYNLGISGTGYGQIGAVADLRLTLVGSVTGTAGTNAGTTSNPQVNRTGLTVANLSNIFYLGSVNPGMTTLPATLISFTAMAVNSGVNLQWISAGETTGDYFTIQRAGDNGVWEDLQRIDATGATAATNAADVSDKAPAGMNYSAFDPSPLSGKSYYRLKTTDRNGVISYSVINTINFSGKIAGITVYPNPSVNYLIIQFSTGLGQAGIARYELSLINEAGQRIVAFTSVNESSRQLDVSNYKAGIYFLQISGAGQMETRKIMIRR